jgi:hypothetical protein
MDKPGKELLLHHIFSKAEGVTGSDFPLRKINHMNLVP